MTENNCKNKLKKNSSSEMSKECPAAKRRPLQCITNNELLDNKTKQTLKEYALKKLEINSTSKLTSSESFEDNCKILSNSSVPNILPLVKKEENADFDHDENMKPLNLTLMECNETLDEFFDDSIALYSSDEDPEIDFSFQNRYNNMVCMVEYRDEMHMFLRETEILIRPKPNYMSKQLEVTVKMRSIMVDWMVDVIEEFKHDRETLHLAVNYVDRFLSVMSVTQGKLQLVGTTALWIAGKFEEIYPPGVKDYSFITDDTYTIEQVIRMEHLMLKVLSFDVAVPTASSFCEQYIKETNVPNMTAILSRYLVDMSLLYSDPFLNYLPSKIASSAIYLANYITNQEYWTNELENKTKYAKEDLKACVYHLYLVYFEADSSPYKAIRNKYLSDRYESVASLQIPSLASFQF